VTEGLSGARRHCAMLALCAGTALAVIDGAIVTVALPTLARQFQVSDAAAVLVVTIYQLVLVMTLLPFSALGYRVGLGRLYQYGQLAFLVATVLCFFARSLPMLLVIRTLQALGGAASLSVSVALIRHIYPPAYLGRGLALNSVIVSAATAFAPSLGGFILAIASWPWIFAAAAPLALLSLLAGWRSLPMSEHSEEAFDATGAILCALTFGLVVGGCEALVHAHVPLLASLLIAAGLVIGSVFVRRELGIERPILPVDLLRRAAIAASALGAMLSFVASMLFILSLPFHLQRHYGFSPREIGLVITPWPLAIMVVAPCAGFLSDRVSRHLLGCVGMAISAAALLLFVWVPAVPTPATLMWRMALCGSGVGLFLIPNARAILHATPLDRSASAGALLSTIRLGGQTLGATVLAALLELGFGDALAPVWLAAALMGAAGLCSSVGGNSARKPLA
jgi:DHA2 family multidrug resistance protein-like MFS transporter